MQIHMDDVALFTRIVALGTLSAAARERNVPVSQVTRALARLEAASGVCLLHRTTHGLSLTDEGDIFLGHGRRLLETTAEMEHQLTGKAAGPSGWVRVTVSPLWADRFVVPGLAGLYQCYPDVRLDIRADDRLADLARDGIDIALRTGAPHSDSVVARRIGTYGRALYASPAYLKSFGVPRKAQDLTRHRLITNSIAPAMNLWTAIGRQSALDVQFSGHTRADSTATMMSLALSGVGIAWLADVMAHSWVRCGQLVPVLPKLFGGERVPVFAVMLQERHRLPKIRACIDYWESSLRDMYPPEPPETIRNKPKLR